MKTFTCPVCGYPDLNQDPNLLNFNICPCCGIEFGYGYTKPEDALLLRKDWVEGGCPWWFNSHPKPENWDPIRQLQQSVRETDEVSQ